MSRGKDRGLVQARRRFLRLKVVSEQPDDQVDYEVEGVAVASVLKLRGVLELVDDASMTARLRSKCLSPSGINRFFMLDLSRVMSSIPWVCRWSDNG